MPVADFLGHFLRSLGQGAAPLFNEISQKAIGGDSGYVQQQENQRQSASLAEQRAQLAQQLNLHNTMTPYETAQLGISQQGRDDSQQEALARLFGQGAEPAAAGEGDIKLGGKEFTIPRPKLHDIGVDTPLGKALGLTEDLTDVPTEKYLQYAEKYAEKGKTSEDKANALAQIEAQAAIARPLIDQRFAPDYYQKLYKGQVDPYADQNRQLHQAQLAAAVAEDKARGTTTQVQQFFNKLDSFQSPWEKMQEKAQERQAGIAAAHATQSDSRSDRSYQFHAGELDKLAKPYEDAASRIGRLRDTVDSGTIQGDALVPAELMIVMAGGQGSGLRVNRSEIEQAMGGRSALQDLEAKVGKWSLDPNKAFLIPKDQRAQIMKLLNIVQAKVVKKNEILTEGRSRLVDSEDPLEHRRILDDVHKRLQKIEAPDVQGQLGLDTKQPLVVPPPPPVGR